MKWIGAWIATLALLAGCGEKITLPEASGIPVVSSYQDATPPQLADAIGFAKDIEKFGGQFVVCDSTGGRVILLRDDGFPNPSRPPVDGLVRPIAMTRDLPRSALLVVEDDDAGYMLAVISAGFELADRGDFGSEVEAVADIVSDGEHLYVSDPSRRTVHRFRLAPAPDVLPLVYEGTIVTDDPDAYDGFSPQILSKPAGLALDGDGMVIACDADSSRNWVLRFDPTPLGGDPTATGTSVVFGLDRQRIAQGPTDPDNAAYTCEGVFSLQASTLGLAPACGAGEGFVLGPSPRDGEFDKPEDVAISGDGHFFVADRMNGRIQRFDANGTFQTGFGPGLVFDGGLQEPTRLAVWDGFDIRPEGAIEIFGARVFVVDAGTGRLLVFEDSRWSELDD